VKLEALSGGDHCWFKRITRKIRPVTRDITIIIIIIIIITGVFCSLTFFQSSKIMQALKIKL
jgi:hypothetical protein